MPQTRNQLITQLRQIITDPQTRQNTALRVRTVLEAIIANTYNLADDTTAVTFAAILANQYGAHPAFTNQIDLNAYLLGRAPLNSAAPVVSNPTFTGDQPTTANPTFSAS